MTDGKRVIAVCDSCGAVYAAKVTSEGKIRPIGTNECTECENATFQIYR